MSRALRVTGFAAAASVVACVAIVSACGSFSALPSEDAGADGGGIEEDASVEAAPACSAAALATDPANCGACGHDCRGAVCAGGTCAPSIVARSAGPITSLTVDSNVLYLTTGVDAGPDAAANAVLTCPASGCGDGTPAVFAGAQERPMSVRVDGDTVYWLDEADDRNRVMTCGRTACGAPRVFFQGPPLEIARALAVDDAHDLFVAVADQSAPATQVTRCAAAGCPDAAAPPLASTQSCGVVDMVFAQGSIFFSDGRVQDDCPNGGLYALPASGAAAATRILTGLNEGVRVASGGSSVYFASTDGIARLPLPSLAPTPIVSLGNGVIDLAADDVGVYWIEASFVRRAPSGGGDPLTLARAQAGPHALALDAEYVYWATAAEAAPGDVVVRVAK